MARSEAAYFKERLFLGINGVCYLLFAIFFVAVSTPDARNVIYFIATLVAFMGIAMSRRAIEGWKDESPETPRVYTKHPPENSVRS